MSGGDGEMSGRVRRGKNGRSEREEERERAKSKISSEEGTGWEGNGPGGKRDMKESVNVPMCRRRSASRRKRRR